jgi:hypothetical protein
MDPLHPILPVPPNIPPVLPPPSVGRVNPDAGRGGDDSERPRRERRKDEYQEDDLPLDAELGPDDEPRPHIDITA